MRHLEGGRRHIPQVVFRRERVDDGPGLFEPASEKGLAERVARSVETPGAHVGRRGNRGDLDLLLGEGLDRAQLALFAGRAGASLARHAAGIDPSGIRRTARPPARIEDRLLPAPTADADTLQAALRVEVERLGLELRSRDVFARTLTLRLRFADGRSDSRTVPLAEPTALDEALLAAATALLARLWPGDRLVSALSVSGAGLFAGTGDAALFPLGRSF